MAETSDNFTKWMLGLMSAAVMAIGVGMITTMIWLREDVAVMKSEFTAVKMQVALVSSIQLQVMNHEFRLGTLEQRTPTDNTRANVGRAYRADTVRSPYSR